MQPFIPLTLCNPLTYKEDPRDKKMEGVMVPKSLYRGEPLDNQKHLI